MNWNPDMKCVHPQHKKKNKGKPEHISKNKFDKKCSGKNKKEPKMCRWVQWYNSKSKR